MHHWPSGPGAAVPPATATATVAATVSDRPARSLANLILLVRLLLVLCQHAQ